VFNEGNVSVKFLKSIFLLWLLKDELGAENQCAWTSVHNFKKVISLLVHFNIGVYVMTKLSQTIIKSENDLVSVVMIGYSGAVGSEVLKTLLSSPHLTSRITLLGRKNIEIKLDASVNLHLIDIMKPELYAPYLKGHTKAVCTLGIGEPSKVPLSEFIRVDKESVLLFAKACKEAGVEHFELLGAVSSSKDSSNYYLRVKGELIEELKELNFLRLSVFQPSMILTPTNRYGFSQGLLLMIWPHLNFVFQGALKKFGGVRVEMLGAAIAKNLFSNGIGFELLNWNDFVRLNRDDV
jgi:uncharacterized protein YbjT (DUF2867 family)